MNAFFHQKPLCRPNSAFTLLEITLSLAVVVVVLGTAVPALTGWQSQTSLRDPSDRLGQMARQAMSMSDEEDRIFMVILDGERISLYRGESRNQSGEHPHLMECFILEKGARLKYRKLGEEKWATPKAYPWRFARGKLCEPLAIRFERGNGYLEQAFHPLTASVREENLYSP
ncbi:MAG: hypothetical protein PHV34_07860 [Verrucomicrobiae bacterium]|nr:hypothetical protein [Verrucomicrobiae bacterium]